jgi:glycine/D-amino acid oxidase-like deaminating enzyme
VGRSSPVNLSDNNWEVKTSGKMQSSWIGELPVPLKFLKLNEDITTDTVIIGGGISGMTTAYLLSRAGNKVVLLEDGYIGSGETGRTTAHITHALDDRYYNLVNNHGPKRARLAAESHTAAIDFIDRIVNTEDINCDFERLDGFLFLDARDKKSSLEKELKSLYSVGISSARIFHESPLSNADISPCIRFPNQAQFQPMVYLQGLASAMTSQSRTKIFTEAHAEEVESAGTKNGKKNKIKTQNGFTISADNVVLATNAPIVDKESKIYDKQQASRTYAIAIRVAKGSVPRALYWDTGNQKSKERVKPYHYVRTQKIPREDNYELLIVGGEDHKTGEIEDLMSANKRFDNLYTWTTEKFSIKGTVTYNWSGQVLEPLDGLAFIGVNPGKSENMYIATGDSGNGITHGTVAGMILSDLILNGKNPWADVYDPSRKIRRNVKTSKRKHTRKR